MQGPLFVHPGNPRYFTDDGVNVIYRTGSHTWANLKDIGLEGSPPFPYMEYPVYLPVGGSLTPNLTNASGSYNGEWVLPLWQRTLPIVQSLQGGNYVVTAVPYTGNGVLYLKRM